MHTYSKRTDLQHHRIDDVRILHRQVEGHTPRRRHSVAPQQAPRKAAEFIAMVGHDHAQQSGNTRSQRMPSKNHLVLPPILLPQSLQRLRLLVQHPHRRFQQPIVHVPAVEHLHPQPVIEQHSVVVLIHQIHTADGEDDLAVVVVGVDQVGRSVAEGLLVVGALHHPFRVDPVAGGGGEPGAAGVRVVDGQDGAADAGDGVELVGGGDGPRGAVVGADVGAALPRPPHAPEHHHPFGAAGNRHFVEQVACSSGIEMPALSNAIPRGGELEQQVL